MSSNIKRFSSFEIINELKVNYVDIDDESDLDNKYVLLIRGNLYILNDDDVHIGDILKKEGIYNNNIESIQDIANSDLNFIYIGKIINGILHNISHNDYFRIYNKRGSEIDKICKQLDLKYYDYYDDSKDEFWYHGTTYNKLKNITKKGLLPIKHLNKRGNFASRYIEHTDKVFLTKNMYVAMTHAYGQSIIDGNILDIPIVIKCKVPDDSKVIPDYDLMIMYYGDDYKDYYDEIDTSMNYSKHKTTINSYKDYTNRYNLEHKFGIIGYIGRIPASHISTTIITPSGYILDSFIKSVIYDDYLDLTDINNDILNISLDPTEISSNNNIRQFDISEFDEYIDSIANEIGIYDEDDYDEDYED